MPTFTPTETEEACPHCFDPSFFQVPSLTKGDKVYKDECMYSFNSNTDTVYVCMKTFRGYSADYIHLHKKNHGGNPLFLAVRKLPKAPKKTEDITDLSQLGVEEPDQFELRVACTECNLLMPENAGLTEEVIVGMKGALSPQLQATIADAAKDSFAVDCPCCATMVQPENRKYKPGNPPKDNQPCWVEGCGHTQNNWICLHCGEVGCPRKEAGGQEHAIFHYMMTGHSVVVKSGTITPLGADLYCYKCNNDVRDPKLKEHLSGIGIDMEKAVKTSKSMAELQLDATHKWDFGKLTEAGKDLKDRFGPGHTGLINLGNSCYMNSVLQSFFAIPEFKARFFDDAAFAEHQENCKLNPANCFQCQMFKLARGFWSGDHSQEGLPYHRQGIAPRDFKTYIAGGHADFSTGEQQDAEEYTRFLLDTLSRKLKEMSGGAALTPQTDPSQLFDFLVEERKQCSVCGAVSYRKSQQNTLCLNLPLEPPADPSKKMEADDRPKTDVKACLDLWTSPNAFDCKCEACGTSGATYVATSKLATFPDVIAIHPRREYFDKNFLTTRKLDCYVDFPEELDLSPYKGSGLQPDEKGMKVSTASSSAKPAFQPDEVAYATLLSMGIEDDAARAALEACSNNAERAIEWVFTEWPAQQAAASETAATTAGGADAADDEPVDPTVATNGDSGKYELFAMISHIGSSAQSGHYIAHVKKEGKWSNCNDEKVKFSEDPPFNMASIFFYRRV